MARRIYEHSIEEVAARLQQGPLVIQKGRAGVSTFRKTAMGYSHEWRPLLGIAGAELEAETLQELMLLMVFGPEATLEPVVVAADEPNGDGKVPPPPQIDEKLINKKADSIL